MTLEKIKEYLQIYLNDIVTPTINKELVGEEDESITLTVYTLLKGSYQPPIFHLFIDIDPDWKGSILKRIEKDIQEFFRIFSINYKVKVHWNKRPVFKGVETPKPFYGETDR